MLKKILVAVDGSPSSLRAAEMAIELASENKSELDVAAVALFSDDSNSMLVKECGAFNKLVNDVVAKAKRRRVKATPIILEGVAEEVLVKLVRKRKSELAVIGYWGSDAFSEIRRLALGNIHSALLREPDVPVLVVK